MNGHSWQNQYSTWSGWKLPLIYRECATESSHTAGQRPGPRWRWYRLEVEALGGKPGLHSARFQRTGCNRSWPPSILLVSGPIIRTLKARFVCAVILHCGRKDFLSGRFLSGRQSSGWTRRPGFWIWSHLLSLTWARRWLSVCRKRTHQPPPLAVRGIIPMMKNYQKKSVRLEITSAFLANP